jgi:hypothetical protein
MYTVTRTQGLDWVEIPGGRLPTAPGEPWLPYTVTSLPVPAGTRVQDVALLERTGLVTDTGLLLPMSPLTPTACACTPEPYAGTEAGWLPEEAFTWETLDNTDGTSTLVITTYPFFYNPQTTASRFYQHYTLELATASTAMALTGLATDQAEYAPGELVGIEVGLLNAGPPQDAVLSTLIRRSGSQEVVAGLPLESLDDLSGPASFAFHWDPGDLEPAYYEVEVTLHDAGGAVLDRESERFRLGTVSGEIVELTASPGLFELGDLIDLSLTFHNNGSAPLSGQARIEIQDETGAPVAEFTHDITELAAGGTVTLPDTWDTAGEPEGTYRIIATVAYDSTATPTASTQVSTQAQNLIYLPLIMR